MKNALFQSLLLAILFFVGECAVAKPPLVEFIISGPGISKSWKVDELLKMPGLKKLQVKSDPGYLRTMTYLAVPLAELFKNLDMSQVSSLSFKCLDGFSGTIDLKRVLNSDPKSSKAYLAIETRDSPWPKLKPGKPETAGPFYLIWENPDNSKIMTEEWPYQLAGLELSDESMEQKYPKTVPGEAKSRNPDVDQGYHLFMSNCFVCHAFNGEGVAKIGPDLNLPRSPSEYFQYESFHTLVRNPQNLRRWEQARMPGFSAVSLSDPELEKIWKYLADMAKRRNLQQ